MTAPTTLDPLSFYAAHGCALFPMRAGSKAPVGIISSFVHDCSKDPAAWAAWAAANPGCNFGVVAGASGLIIVDIDVKAGRDEAWAAWCSLCADWGVPVQMPHVATPSGGWHVYFACSSPDLRQPDAIKGIINIRAGNGFTVAAGSTYADRPYVLLSADAPYPAPEALVRHCTRAIPAADARAAGVGTREAGDVAALLTWMVERDCFAAYEDWVGCGMALRTEFGDAGLDLWRLTHDATVTPDVEATKWSSFSTDATSTSVTLNSLLARASSLGWRGTVRKSTSAMFGTVAALAQAAGASLPGSSQPMPMVGWQEEFARQSAPRLADFLSATASAPTRPAAADFPTLPSSVSGHALFDPMQQCIARIIALAETPKFKSSQVEDALATLKHLHLETYNAVRQRLANMGVTVNGTKIDQRSIAIERDVSKHFRDYGNWKCDVKGRPESDNPDNVVVLLGVCGLRVRQNLWLEQPEICSERSENWVKVDDATIEDLLTRAKESDTRFCPGKDFLWDTVKSLARKNPVDPAADRLDALATTWDGQPRLSTWLSRTCGTPCDIYHQAVSRNIIGGMVRRIREPGCKHDTMPILFGYQGSGKSTVAKIIADMGQTSFAGLTAGHGQWFTDTIQLGDEAKELVLALGGIAVAEIGEMGTRNQASVNHIKAMVSRDADRGRTAYARTVSARPRRNIFFGTTNDDEPLVDPTGNRRFLPVRVEHAVDLEWLHANVSQLIGEAAVLHSRGETFAIPRAVWGVAAEHQEAARSVSDVEVALHDWFSATSFTHDAFVTAFDLDDVCRKAGLRANREKATVMKGLGFVQAYRMIGGKKSRVWIRGAGTVRYGVGTDVHGNVRVSIGAASAEG